MAVKKDCSMKSKKKQHDQILMNMRNNKVNRYILPTNSAHYSMLGCSRDEMMACQTLMAEMMAGWKAVH
jgi:hypothetical protein